MDNVTPIRDGPKPLRTLPHNTEAEMGLLGGIFVESGNTILDAVAGFLKPEHFSREAHGLVFDKCLAMHQRGEVVDPVTIKGLFNAEALVDIGGAGYLAELAADCVTPINAKEYARIVFDLWRRRELIAAGEGLVEAAYDPEMAEATDAIMEQHEAALAVLSDHDADKGGLIPVAEIIGPTIETIERAASAATPVGLPTGINDLDRFLGGLMPSDLIVVAARPGMGKTAFALTVARANALQGKRVGFFSLEMSAEQLMMRALAMDTGISATDMRTGGISEVQVGTIRTAGQSITGLPLLIDDRGGVSVSYIKTKAKGMKRKHGLDMVVIDYLNLLRPDERYSGQRVNEVSQITAALKALAKELGVPVVLLSQLNRGVEQRDDRRPRLADLRDSGSIEQDADVVIFIYREAYYIEQEGEPTARAGEDEGDFVDRHTAWMRRREDARGKADIIVSKQRQGRTGTVKAYFNEERTMFGDLVK